MVELESEESPKTGRLRRVLSWLPGVLLLAGLVVVATHFSEGRKFALLLEQARSAWILVAALLQGATYVCAAAVWQRVLRKGRARCTVRSLIPVAVARLFVDQVIPTAGFGGRLLVMRALSRRRVHTRLAVAAILVDLLTLYVAFAVCVLASLAIVAALRDLNRLVLSLAGLFPLFALSIPAAVLWLSRGKQRELPRWVRWIAWGGLAFEILLVLSARAHYTIDVIGGLFVGYATHRISLDLFPDSRTA